MLHFDYCLIIQETGFYGYFCHLCPTSCGIFYWYFSTFTTCLLVYFVAIRSENCSTRGKIPITWWWNCRTAKQCPVPWDTLNNISKRKNIIFTLDAAVTDCREAKDQNCPVLVQVFLQQVLGIKDIIYIQSAHRLW